MFENLVKTQSSTIECKEESPSLDQVLKISINDSSFASLRIPKVTKHPPDFKLISGYTSMLIHVIVKVIHFKCWSKIGILPC